MQSRRMSLAESITNVVVGYVLAIATQLMVFPLFGIEAAFGEHLAIGFAFVGVSLARGYLLRRLFEVISLPRGLSCHHCTRPDHGTHKETSRRKSLARHVQ